MDAENINNIPQAGTPERGESHLPQGSSPHGSEGGHFLHGDTAAITKQSGPEILITDSSSTQPPLVAGVERAAETISSDSSRANTPLAMEEDSQSVISQKSGATFVASRLQGIELDG